ncbi:dihydrolipoyl dehydrogenase [Taylorella equigenitalis]|uniref:Dihydrolipoyl dehydrogenase n=1 Tax=Taylorella equigenitalis ATCC 35865 TaxID=743973 RepID=A0ABN4AVF2_9BURK|nr:dihydrolipoyl dehydrogenase [Taylorella equigenitalis]AFN35857.1 dihydrolipoamide dehydrogenase [Taylorella equigenitalis ATCC 35865]ASY39271.1 dihydrolipoyl dehydrogenase [Taylorella equigenitalis]VEG30901.1 Dihydrolipoyl dehydrogenase [Taylorella equigenitalis ATCC 35865]
MSQIIKIPDIGDFKDVTVIEVLVKSGDRIEENQSLLTVESDKASMEIPSNKSGVVKSVLIKLGDKVNQGDDILEIESDSASSAISDNISKKPEETTAQSQTKENVSESIMADETRSKGDSIGKSSSFDYDLIVLGAGPGGYSAAFRAADLGLKTAIIERNPTLGGVCLNVGCIPSKALLHNVGVLEEAKHLASNGITFSKPKIDIEKLRDYKNSVVKKLTTGLASMAKARKVEILKGTGKFKDSHTFTVLDESGLSKDYSFKNCIIAAGSESINLPFLPKDERIVDSTGALELPFIPKRMLIIGAGIIGLEMGTVYSSLGAKVDVVEMGDVVMRGADKDIVKVWEKFNVGRFENIFLNTKTVSAEAKKDGIHVSFEGDKAPTKPQVYDLVLQAVGRSPNGKLIAVENAGIRVDEKGFIPVSDHMRTNVDHIFAIGDIVGQPMLAHKAVHEGHVAAEVISGQKVAFEARVIPSVAYTNPEVAWVGITESKAKEEGIDIEVGLFPWVASGRAIANGRDEGLTKLIFDAQTHKILGASIVGTNAGDLICEPALAIEMGADVVDIAKTIHPHPTLGESIGMAAEVAHGSCTDLPPKRKK